MRAKMRHRSVHVVHVKCKVVASEVAVSRWNLALVRHVVLEQLQVEPEAKPQETHIADLGRRIHTKSCRQIILSRSDRTEIIERFRPKHLDEEMARRCQVRNRDAEMIATAEPW